MNKFFSIFPLILFFLCIALPTTGHGRTESSTDPVAEPLFKTSPKEAFRGPDGEEGAEKESLKKIDESFRKLLLVLGEARRLDEPALIESMEKRISELREKLDALLEGERQGDSRRAAAIGGETIPYVPDRHIAVDEWTDPWREGEDFRVRLGEEVPEAVIPEEPAVDVEAVAEIPFELKYRFVISSSEYAMEPDDGRIELIVSIEENFKTSKGA